MAKKARRPSRWQSRAASIMPANAPTWIIIEAMPDQMVRRLARSEPVSPWDSNVFLSTLRCRSIAKKPMPHRPITPAQASSMPMIAFLRQRGSAKSAA